MATDRPTLIWQLLIASTLVAVLALIATLYYSSRRADEWHAFKDQHHCRIVAHKNGRVGTNDGWLCDDGKTYWH